MASDRNQRSVIEQFTAADLGRVRGLVERAARLVGLSRTRSDNLVAAVNEVAINAILHAGATGSVTVEQSADGVSVEIRDHGPGLPSDLSTDRPPPDALGGRGLWLARRLCHHLNIASSPWGVTVRMFMPAGSPRMVTA
jgi:anti-sigma regulatory factor (Ser/Thr protein kinase)